MALEGKVSFPSKPRQGEEKAMVGSRKGGGGLGTKGHISQAGAEGWGMRDVGLQHGSEPRASYPENGVLILRGW